MDPDLWLPRQLLFDKHFTLKRYEVAGRRVLFYFDEVLLSLGWDWAQGWRLLQQPCW